MKNKNGFTLIAAIFIVLVMTLLAITTSTFVSSDAVIAVKNYHSLDAFYISSAGVEYYLKQLYGDSDWSSPPTRETKSFSGGVFTITTTNESKNRITFTSTGLVTIETTTYRRGVRTTIQRTGGTLGEILGEYVIYLGGGGEGGAEGSTFGNNVTIDGDIFVNSDLTIGNNGNISGDVYATGEVTLGAGSTVEGTTESQVEPVQDPPTLETTYYDGQIAIAAGEPAGNWNFGNNTLSGWYYINGNVNVQSNADITITGSATIVATGKVSIGNNASIGDSFTVIADDQIDIANNVDIGTGGFWYSSVGIEVGNNADSGGVNVGEGTVFITPGNVVFGNNVQYYGFIYCTGEFLQTGNTFYFEGNMIVGGDITIDNNSTLVLNSTLVESDDLIGVIGPGGGTGTGEDIYDLTDWDEVY